MKSEFVSGPQSWTVYVDDNFHYMDETERYHLGDFDSYAEAVEACKAIVERFVSSHFKPGMTAEELLSQYKSFGEDPFIVGDNSIPEFSAWEYARSRVDEICTELPPSVPTDHVTPLHDVIVNMPKDRLGELVRVGAKLAQIDRASKGIAPMPETAPVAKTSSSPTKRPGASKGFKDFDATDSFKTAKMLEGLADSKGRSTLLQRQSPEDQIAPSLVRQARSKEEGDNSRLRPAELTSSVMVPARKVSNLPGTWWGKAALWTYVLGYFLYIIAAGISAWPHLTLYQWWNYMAFQGVYGIGWPIILIWSVF